MTMPAKMAVKMPPVLMVRSLQSFASCAVMGDRRDVNVPGIANRTLSG